MFEGLTIETSFHKEKIHMKEGEEVLEDGDKWYLVAGALVLATIIYQKYVNFLMYTVKYTEVSIDGTVNPIPHELKNKKTLQEAKESIRTCLKISNG